jgi:recombinational DNA repair protein RecR
MRIAGSTTCSGGTLSPLGGVGPEDLSIRPLLGRLEAGGVEEVILRPAGRPWTARRPRIT